MRKISFLLVIVLMISLMPATYATESDITPVTEVEHASQDAATAEVEETSQDAAETDAGTAIENDYTPQAEALKCLGLFLGTENGFELQRPATRAESAVMTVRLLGKESDAKDADFKHPFTDVPEWASPYVGYLYENGIAKGVSDTLYDSAELITPVQYATLVLRALGFNDSAGDFVWNESLDKMVELEIVTDEQASDFAANSNLSRGGVVAISYLGLFADFKGTNTSLLERFYLEDKLVTSEQLGAASAFDARLFMFSNIYGVAKPYPAGDALDSEEIFSKTSDAVFMIETRGLLDSGYEASTGSGFFITSDGIAVTNMHVIEDMSSTTIMTTDGKIYPVEGLLALDADADLAIIKVQGNGFPYLEIGDPDALRTAQRIYCVGSPLGFDNTISDGLVSSPKREYEGYTYIQTSAPIAPGSSGGALLNEYGQVVGVTTLGSYFGQINMAIPITALAELLHFPTMRSIRYFQAHSHFGLAPFALEDSYVRAESSDENPVQIMINNTVMFGTIKSADDVHRYFLDANATAEALLTLTSDSNHSAGLKFEVSTLDDEVILTSRHYDGEIFSLTTGLVSAEGLYTVKIYVDDESEPVKDWSNVNYELFWGYHVTFEVSGDTLYLSEFEPNNTAEHANYIPDLYMYFATISDKNDVDYYSFTIAEDSTYISTLELFGHSELEYGETGLYAEVFASDGTSVGKFTSDDDYDYFEQDLDAGTYYIKVWVKNTSVTWDNDFYAIDGWYLELDEVDD